MNWIKSSFCNRGDCVEVVQREADQILMRDSKNPDGTVIVFTREEWQAFTDSVKAGEFDMGED